MPLRRLSAIAPLAGAYTSPGAMDRQIVFMAPSGRNQDGSDRPYSPVATSWAAIRPLQGQELDKAQQIADEVSHLVSTPWQPDITQQMRIVYQDGSDARQFEIKAIIPPDERQFELRFLCFELENLEEATFAAPLSVSQSGIYVAPTGGGGGGSLVGIWSEGSSAPGALQTDGDYYLDLSTGDVYLQTSGTWGSPIGNIKGGAAVPSLIYHKVSASSDNAASIKASAGTVTGWKIYNNAGYPVYVKLYDKATSPNPASDTPKQVIGIDAGMQEVSNSTGGFSYTSGIAIAIVKGIADNDDTAVALDDCTVDIFYQ